jgi:4-amino-4-deoxy-L-arabinose transferase-like glycosyltransferase
VQAEEQPREVARWRPVAVVLGLVAVLQAAFLFATRNDPLFRAPDLDEAYYHIWARSLAEGQGDFQGPYFLAPLYPHALAALYRLGGPNPFAARVVQTLLGLAAVLLVFALGRKIFGRTAGIAAAALLGLCGPLVFYEGLLLVEVLYLVLVLAALAALLLPAWPPLVRGAVTGGLLGLAALGRATALIAVPVAILTLWRGPAWAGGLRPKRRRMPATLACVLACALVLFPVCWRNARLGGGFVLTTNGGVNLAAGNFAGATGRFHAPEGVRFFDTRLPPNASPHAPLPPDVARTVLTVRGAAGTERAADSHAWTQQVSRWVREHPGDALVLLVRKFGLVLQAREETHLESFGFHRARLLPLRCFPVDFGWLWPLAALGGWIAWREKQREAGIVAAFGIAMLLPCLLFFVSSRYRLAAAPMLAVFAGGGAAWLFHMVRARAWRPLGAALVPVAALAGLVHVGSAAPAAQRSWEFAQMAARSYALGDLAGAITAQEEAARLAPQSAAAQLDLARYWSERGTPADWTRAEALLRGTARRWPGRADVPYLLGTLLVRQGRVDEARAAWQEALRIDPQFEPARERLRDMPR